MNIAYTIVVVRRKPTRRNVPTTTNAFLRAAQPYTQLQGERQ